MGAGAVSGLEQGFKANAALLRYRIVEMTDDDSVAHANAAGDGMIGVAQHPADANETCLVQLTGITNVQAGGAITRGALISSNATGQGIVTTTQGSRYIGVALKAAVSGDYFPVLLSLGSV